MDPRSPSSPGGINPATTNPTSISSRENRRGESSSNMTTSSSGSLIDSRDRYRMGVPGALRPLPLDLYVIKSSDAISRAYDIIQPVIHDKFRQFNVSWTAVHVLKRCFPGRSPTDDDVTIYITSPQDDNDSWVLFLDAISDFLKSIGWDNLLVEIIHPIAEAGLRTFTVRENDQITLDWPDLRLKVLQELRMEYNWIALHVLRRGYRRDGGDSEVSVVVLCKNFFDPHWGPVSSRIREILSHADYEIRLEIIEATSCRSRIELPSTALSAEAFCKVVDMGKSIGCERGAGTLGGYVNLIDNQQRYKTFGLTNYHVVRTSAMTPRYDNEGARNANESGCAVDISSPALIDVEKSIEVVDMQIMLQEKRMAGIKFKVDMGEESYRERLRKVEEKVTQLNADKQKMQNFPTHFGQVHSFSGFRKTTSNFALDWALIDVVQPRIGLNEIPFSERFPGTNYQNNSFLMTGVSTSCFRAGQEKQVFKHGRTTGETWGKLNHIKVDVVLEDDGVKRVYSAWTALVEGERKGEEFMCAGDSGSFLLDCQGNLCGLLFANHDPRIGGGDSKPFAYLTPIDMVFQDIETITGFKLAIP